jgi:hypothetical protein
VALSVQRLLRPLCRLIARRRVRRRRERFFVTVTAPSREALLALSALDLDLFPVTAREADKGEATIEGLLTRAEIASLEERDYRVRVDEHVSKRARAHETMTFEEWRRENEEQPGAGR